jgi:hypothetical protein
MTPAALRAAVCLLLLVGTLAAPETSNQRPCLALAGPPHLSERRDRVVPALLRQHCHRAADAGCEDEGFQGCEYHSRTAGSPAAGRVMRSAPSSARALTIGHPVAFLRASYAAEGRSSSRATKAVRGDLEKRVDAPSFVVLAFRLHHGTRRPGLREILDQQEAAALGQNVPRRPLPRAFFVAAAEQPRSSCGFAVSSAMLRPARSTASGLTHSSFFTRTFTSPF